MKKLLALALCLLMAFGTVLPIFAETEIPGAAEDFAAGYTETHDFADAVDYNLANNPSIIHQPSRPNWGKPGFMYGVYGETSAYAGQSMITLWGSKTTDDLGNANHGPWAKDVTYQVPFTVPVTGLYTFKLNGVFDNENSSIPNNVSESAHVPLRIDDEYETNLSLPYGYVGKNSFTAFLSIYLEAGEHIFHIQKHVNCLETNYYWSFTYTLNATAEDMAGGPGTYNFVDFADEAYATPGESVKIKQPTLFNQRVQMANHAKGQPLWGVEGYSDAGGSLLFWGPNAGGAWTYTNGGSFQVPFYAPKNGYYTFTFEMTYRNKDAVSTIYTPVKIDTTEYQIATPANTAGNNVNLGGIDNIYLDAGAHMMYVCPPNSTQTHQYHSFTYKLVAEASSSDQTSGTVTYEFIDFADSQTTLFNQTETMKNHPKGQPDWGKEGFAESSNGGHSAIIFFGKNSGGQWMYNNGGCYEVSFLAPVTGDYTFSIVMSKGATTSEEIYTPIKVDAYEMKLASPLATTAPQTYMLETIHLVEGVHTFYVYPPTLTTANHWYHSFTYTYEADKTEGEDAADDTLYSQINPLPAMGGAVAGAALAQPHLNVINPIAPPATEETIDTTVNAPSAPAATDAPAIAPAPQQPHLPTVKPAEPNKPGSHRGQTPALPA